MPDGKDVRQDFRGYAKNFAQKVITAGTSAAIVVTVMAPIERVKLIKQVQRSFPEFLSTSQSNRGLFSTITHLVQQQGWRDLWRGNTAAIYRTFPYQAVNFATKDTVQAFINTRQDHHLPGQVAAISLLSGGFAGCAALTTVYPLDYARTRMALDLRNSTKECGKRKKTRSVLEVIRSRYSKYGLAGVYRGYGFAILGVFWYRAFYFGIYDFSKAFTPKNYRNLAITILEAEVASVSSGFLVYPMDTIRRHMMMQGSLTKTKQQHKAWASAKIIYGEGGIFRFYEGAGINLIRSCGGALMLVLYDVFEEQIWNRDRYALVTETGLEVPCNRKKKDKTAES